jgi:hypothetical protein
MSFILWRQTIIIQDFINLVSLSSFRSFLWYYFLTQPVLHFFISHSKVPNDLFLPSPALHFETSQVLLIHFPKCPTYSTTQLCAPNVHFANFLIKFILILLVERPCFLLNATFVMAVLDLISRVHKVHCTLKNLVVVIIITSLNNFGENCLSVFRTKLYRRLGIRFTFWLCSICILQCRLQPCTDTAVSNWSFS